MFYFKLNRSIDKLFDNNILIEETINKYGYNPKSLKPASCKLVVQICINCKVKKDKIYRYAIKQKLCLNCSNKINAVNSISKRSVSMKKYYKNGGTHPLKAKGGHSEESKRKMSISQKKVIRKTLSQEEKEVLRIRCMEVLNNPVQKAKTAALNRLRVGPLSWAYGKTPNHLRRYWYSDNGVSMFFRSSWELKFAEWLTENEFYWQYEYKTFPVEYEIDGTFKKGTYTPDFLIDGIWYEVKGYWTTIGLAKYRAFKKIYPNEKIKTIRRKWFKRRNLIK